MTNVTVTNRKNLLASFRLCDDAFHLVESAVCARRTVFDDITSDFSGSAALTSLGGSPLDGSTLTVGHACSSGRTFLALRRRI
jgi:hypothetical protein